MFEGCVLLESIVLISDFGKLLDIDGDFGVWFLVTLFCLMVELMI